MAVLRHIVLASLLLALSPMHLQQPASAEITDENQKIVADNWHQIYHRFSQISIDHQRLDELLGPIMGHQFNISRQQMRRGLVYKGAGYRMRHAVRKLLKGDQPVKVGVVGGSVTFLEDDVKAIGWWAKLARYITLAFPKTKVIAKNGAVPGTPSAYALMCLELMVDEDVDIVFIEYVLNDGFDNVILDSRVGKIYERLVRKILAKPNMPAVVMMQVTTHGQGFAEPHAREFHMSPEETYGGLAQYYDASWLSFRDAFWRLGRLHREGYNASDFFYSDYLHPGGLGQKLMSDLAVMLIQDTVIDLLMFPWSQQDQAMLNEPIPPPMYPGNWETTNKLCLHNEDFKAVATATNNFTYVNEGTDKKPKWGYVGNAPGASLTLTFNTSQEANAQKAQEVNVYLAYLKSYQHMGTALVQCVAGCSCKEYMLDAHHEDSSSQTYLAKLTTTQHDQCMVRITVQEASRSGEHKIKVSGIMIGTVSKSGVDYDYPEGSWGMERWHHLADANAEHLTNTEYFEPEDAHPQGYAADEQKRLEQEEREKAAREAKTGGSVHKEGRRLMERRSLVEVPAWLHRLWKQWMG